VASAKGTAIPIEIEKAKFLGKTVGKEERAHADRIEARVARWLGATRKTGYKADDVRLKTRGMTHHVEVKTKLTGSKQALTVHDDALHRKALIVNSSPNAEFHTIVVDERHRYQGGAHKSNYSGHNLYYRRGSGPWTLSSMHKVSDPRELRRLVESPEHELPAKARGTLRMSEEELETLRARAAAASESRKQRQESYKARLAAEGLTRHGKRINPDVR